MDITWDYATHHVSYWIVGCTVAVGALYLYLVRDFGRLKKYGIDGPKAYPFVGTAWSMMTKGLMEFDMELYMKYRDKKICGVYEFGRPGIIVYDPKMIKEILVKEFHNFTNRATIIEPVPPMDRAVISIRNDHWRLVRNTISPTFSGAKLKLMTPLIQGHAESLAQAMLRICENGEAFSAKNLFGSYTMDTIASTMFGLNIDSLNDPGHPFVKHIQAFIGQGSIRTKLIVSLAIIVPRIARLLSKLGINFQPTEELNYFKNHLEAALKDRRMEDEEYHDFLAQMVKSEVSDDKMDKVSDDGLKWSSQGLTKDDIVAQMIIFFVAGYETTANMMQFAAYEMVMNPDLQDRLRDEVDELIGDETPNYDNVHKLTYMDMFLSETQRKYPQAPRLIREPKEEIEICGVTIPKGVNVWIPPYPLHRDPDVWPDPEKFDPERFSPEEKAARDPFYFIPFGMGPRNCVGMRLALLEAKIGLARMLQKCLLKAHEETPVKITVEKFRMWPVVPIKLLAVPRD